METKKEMTIDKLAEIIQREFIVAQDERRSLQSDIRSLQNEMINMKRETNKRFEEINNKFDEKFNRVLTSQDRISNILVNLETDNTTGAGASLRQTDKLDNHEERIIIVEKKLGLKMAV